METLVGPKGFGALDGYGMLVEGFEFRPAMTMMNYNPPYYPRFLERLGFEKEVDFVSCYLHRDRFRLPERVHRVAERAAAAQRAARAPLSRPRTSCGAGRDGLAKPTTGPSSTTGSTTR